MATGTSAVAAASENLQVTQLEAEAAVIEANAAAAVAEAGAREAVAEVVAENAGEEPTPELEIDETWLTEKFASLESLVNQLLANQSQNQTTNLELLTNLSQNQQLTQILEVLKLLTPTPSPEPATPTPPPANPDESAVAPSVPPTEPVRKRAKRI